MADYPMIFSKIADDLPQVVNPDTGDYFTADQYWWLFLISNGNETFWDNNGGYNHFYEDTDNQGNVFYYSFNLYFIPTVAYLGIDNVKLEKGLYIAYSELDDEMLNAVRLIDINTGGGPA